VASEPLVYIILVTWNRKDDTLECLRSLQQITYRNYRIIVVDNASHDGTQEAVQKEFPSVEYIFNPTNLRFAGGNNVGIRRALDLQAEYVLLLNNDTIVAPEFLTNLVTAAEKNSKVGLTGAKIYYYDQPERLWYAGGNISWWKGWISHRGVREIDHGQYDNEEPTDYITGCCILAKRNVIENIGMLDESFFIYGEDADWSIRAARAGYLLLYVPSARVWHKLSVSSGGHLSWFKNWNKLKSQLRLMARYAKPYYWLTIPVGLLFNVILSFLRVQREK
jgi:hypothetical protein